MGLTVESRGRTVRQVPISSARMDMAMRSRTAPSFPTPEDIPFLQNKGARVTVIVLDSAGIGVMPRHPDVDVDANTIANTATWYDRRFPGKFSLPNFQRLGLGNIARSAGFQIPGVHPAESPLASFGRLSLDPVPNTDTIVGHWGLMGRNSEAYPIYLGGIPHEIMGSVEARVSVGLGIPFGFIKDGRNISGTTVIEEDGAEARETKRPIIYTSSDSVFQIAFRIGREIGPGETIPSGHELIEEEGRRIAVSIEAKERMYQVSNLCRQILDEGPEESRFLRVITRPFVDRREHGPKGEQFVRVSSLRKDYASAVPGPTVLDAAVSTGYMTIGVGKFFDIFTGRGIQRTLPMGRHLVDDMEGIDLTIQALRETSSGIIGVNLVDLDERYGHRNDPSGYAGNLMRIDARLPEILAAMRPWDITVITADHGNDPTRGLSRDVDPVEFARRGTNHTREYVPLLVVGNLVVGGVDLGVGALANVGTTAAHYLGVELPRDGNSFLEWILDESLIHFVRG